MATKRRTIEIPMNVDVPLDVADSLDEFCDKRKVTKKSTVELALRRFLVAEQEPK